MAITTISGRGFRTTAALFAILSISLLLSACWLFAKPSAVTINAIVALVGQSNGSTSAGVHVFYNNGNGTFTAGPVLDVATSGYTDLALGNLADHAAPSDGGSPVNDIFVTNNGKSPNEVWINNGSGSFTQHVEPWSTQPSTTVALGPIFGVAGEVDAFVANGTSAPKIWQNAAKDGAFTEYTSGEGFLSEAYSGANSQYASTPYDTVALGMGALSGSGGTSGDVFTGNLGQQNQVYQDKNGYDGTYANTTKTPTTAGGDKSQSVAVGDLNGDGLPDVFVANNGQNYVYFNSNGSSGSSYNFGPPVPVGATSHDSTAVALGKLGSDGTMYAFVVNNGAPDTVWKYNGADDFTPVTEPSFTGTAAGTAVALGDLNGDGILDAVVASGGSNGTISVWLGNGDGTFTRVNERSIPSGDYVAVAIGRLR